MNIILHLIKTKSQNYLSSISMKIQLNLLKFNTLNSILKAQIQNEMLKFRFEMKIISQTFN